MLKNSISVLGIYIRDNNDNIRKNRTHKTPKRIFVNTSGRIVKRNVWKISACKYILLLKYF